MNIGTQMLTNGGVSIWLDDLSRSRLESGGLARLISERHVTGVTTNPAIFSAAISHDKAYDAALDTCRSEGLTAAQTVTRLTTDDVRAACDVFADVYARTSGLDGRVSIEVEPELAHDHPATVQRAVELWRLVDRENAMIKIPATVAGLAAIADTIAEGISVNVTLIFSLTRYREVLNAYFAGVERARAAGKDISKIHSVASFFISRFDTAVDPALDASDDPSVQALAGQLSIANAREAYEAFSSASQTVRAMFLAEQGMNPQRLLWASTGVKDARLPATHYVTELAAEHTVNTMPEATLEATALLERAEANHLTTSHRDAPLQLAQLRAVGLDYRTVTDELEREGLDKFEVAWAELLRSVDERLAGSE